MNCPRCGAILYPGYNVCANCNLPLRTQPPVAQAPFYQPPNAQPGPGAPLPQPQAAQAPYYPPQGVPQNAQPRPGASLPWPPEQRSGIAGAPQNILVETPWPAARDKIQLPRKKEHREQEESDNERLMVFSDAVIAFAITVSAVPLKVPRLTSLRDIFSQQFSAELALYIFSFFLIYGLWKEHHEIFHHIKRNNGWLIALNMFFLAMIVCIPVGFIILIDGFNNLSNTTPPIHNDALLTIGFGALIYLGAQFCAIILLLLLWWSAQSKPAALFGSKAPEKPFRVYMTWRLVFQILSFVVYTAAFFLIIPLSLPLFLVALAILSLCLGSRWLVLGLYRRNHREELDLNLGGEDTMRVQLFSDAVFAVAVTITVAQIDPNAEIGSKVSNFSFLGTYVFSFLILGIYWLLHYRIFHMIRRLNRTLVLLNFWFLLLITLAFIPARLYTGFMFDKVHNIIFSIYQVVTAGILWVLWRYAKKHRERTGYMMPLLKEEVTQWQSRRLDWIVGANPCIFLALAIVAFFTPILAPLYVAAYLALLGGIALIVQWTTRSSDNSPLVQT